MPEDSKKPISTFFLSENKDINSDNIQRVYLTVCESCGNVVPDDYINCPKCGHMVLVKTEQ